MTRRFDIVPAGLEHEAWIRVSFAKSARDNGGLLNWVPRPILVDDFLRRRRDPDAVCAVASVRNEPDLFLGWLAAVPSRNEVTFGFTKYHYRQQEQWRICTTLAEEMGIDFSRPVGVRFWTRAAQRIALKPGYRLYHVVTEPEDERSAA